MGRSLCQGLFLMLTLREILFTDAAMYRPSLHTKLTQRASAEAAVAAPPTMPACESSFIGEATQRFSRMLQFNTVSDQSAPLHVMHPEEFKSMHTWLEGAYPKVWESLKVERVGEGELSLLLTWPGTQPELDPLLMISHLDVVPVAEEQLEKWTYPPFSGAIEEGYIWGRGALDVKIGVIGILEAITLLLEENWAPTRTLILGFGQDEEVQGNFGAGKTAQLLKSRGMCSLDAVVDEGPSVFVDGFAPYTSQPIAMVATAEKGYYSVKLRINTVGGHSSVPPLDHSSIGALVGRVLSVLEANPPPGALVSPVTDFLKAIAPIVEKPWLKAMFSQPEKPEYADRILNAHLLVDSPLTAALARTTLAVTGLSSYVGDNVLPPSADINLNFRLLPGSTVDGSGEQSVMQYLKDTLGEELLPYITFTTVFPDASKEEVEATPVTTAEGRHFKALQAALEENWVFDGTPVTVSPFMLTGGTDSRHYMSMSKGGVLRFVPTSTNRTAGDDARVHGLNERLSVDDLCRAVKTYRGAIKLLVGA